MANIYESVNTLYSKSSNFWEKYGGSVFMTGFTIIIFFLLISYFNILINIQPIKDDWVNQRCSPSVMPFAGIINPPPGMSAFEYTNQNFESCTQGILKEITGFFFIPINLFVDFLNKIFTAIKAAINKIREIFNLLRERVKKIAEEIMGKILNVMIPLQKVIISVNDFFGKVQGILTSGLYTSLATYYTMKSAVGAFFQFVVIILIIIAAMVMGFWAGLVTIPMAILWTVIFLLIAIPLALIAVALQRAFRLSLPGIPSKPSCYSKNTIIETADGLITIDKLKPGTTLRNGSFVTSIMKLNSEGHDMYMLNNIIVSGIHKVLYNNNFIEVSEHPYSKKITNFNESYLYCLNTSNKYIEINDTYFLDWDELTSDEIRELIEYCNKNIENNDLSFVHKEFESGFHKNTPIELIDGTIKDICKIKIMDKLKNNEIVLGTVEIDTKNIKNYKYYLQNNVEIIGGPNLQMYDANLGILHTLDNTIMKKPYKKSNKLYHLVTDKSSFDILGYKFYDYNGALDCFLKGEKYELLSNQIL